MLSRRGFLQARFRADVSDQRPPWALAEDAFEARCNRCGDCIKACPTAILVAGGGGYPRVDFSHGECTFCGECVKACEPRALSRDDSTRSPWALRAAIGDSCLAHRGVECRVCGESCSEEAIRFRPRLGAVAQPELDEARCTGCGACYKPCPVSAIGVKNAVENRE
jgi:ferredoxin-type protein NapF